MPCLVAGCATNATCIDNGNCGAKCFCNAGYYGDGVACSCDPCSLDPCDPNATCVEDDDPSNCNPICTCNANFTGNGLVCSPA
eukprot:SM000042S15290  [mRNA]  locus=s42:109965:110546:+ [translate_table: standard]